MRRNLSAAAADDAPAIRIAWWASFIATIALVAILGLAKSAQAQVLTVPGPAPTGDVALLAPALDEEFEAEDEDEAEASEGEELEAEECAADEEECEEEAGLEAPPECLLSSAQATIAVAANHDKVHLQVHYTTSSPTAVAVAYGLHGSKGSLYLGSDKRLFAKRGVLRLTKSLTEAQMEKVMAAKDFSVRLRVAGAPHYCQSLFDRQLDVRRATPTGLTWEQSE
jgi:hypothetical protein